MLRSLRFPACLLQASSSLLASSHAERLTRSLGLMADVRTSSFSGSGVKLQIESVKHQFFLAHSGYSIVRARKGCCENCRELAVTTRLGITLGRDRMSWLSFNPKLCGVFFSGLGLLFFPISELL